MILKTDVPEFQTLDKINSLFDKAANDLSHKIGIPLCVPGCGQCCRDNNIQVKGVEAHYAAQWVRQQGKDFEDKIVRVCEEWLLKRHDKLGVYMGVGTMPGMTPEVLDQLNSEVVYTGLKIGCPFLDEGQHCLIYPARPIACRAFGVTRVFATNQCRRPISKYETSMNRAFINDENCSKIRDLIEKLKKEIDGKYEQDCGFLASMLYLELRPQKWMDHAYHNEIASAKLVMLHAGFILWQEQVNEQADREAEIMMLVDPVPAVPFDYEFLERCLKAKESSGKAEILEGGER